MIGIDPVVETLLLPFRDGMLNWPEDGTLFLRARMSTALKLAAPPKLVCEQSFKPDADALARAGLSVDHSHAGKFSIVLLLPPRQRDEARALMARAIASLKPEGRIVACVANNEGAKSSEADLKKLCGPVTTISKNKCRAFWTAPLSAPADSALYTDWLALDAPRRICDEKYLSRPGIFAWDRIDIASELLAHHLPPDLTGHAADLGAGFGFLSAELLTRCPRIKSLDVYEAEKRALDLARENLARFENRVRIRCEWHDVTEGLLDKYDVIVTNPPFHTHSQNDRPDIGRRFIAAAAQSLSPRGRLWLVANRHLPYEATLAQGFERVRSVAQMQGFKIIEAIKSAK